MAPRASGGDGDVDAFNAALSAEVQAPSHPSGSLNGLLPAISEQMQRRDGRIREGMAALRGTDIRSYSVVLNEYLERNITQELLAKVLKSTATSIDALTKLT
jgi:hypothetical protein